MHRVLSAKNIVPILSFAIVDAVATPNHKQCSQQKQQRRRRAVHSAARFGLTRYFIIVLCRKGVLHSALEFGRLLRNQAHQALTVRFSGGLLSRQAEVESGGSPVGHRLQRNQCSCSSTEYSGRWGSGPPSNLSQAPQKEGDTDNLIDPLPMT